MTRVRRRKEISFLVWGVPGVVSVLAFAFAVFAGDDGPMLALAGFYGIAASLAGHALTCFAIDRFSRRE